MFFVILTAQVHWSQLDCDLQLMDSSWPFAAIGDCWLRGSASERKAAIHFVGVSVM
jgi:hypothetical protein